MVRRVRRFLKLALSAIAAVVGLVVALAVAWAVDASAHGGTVARNVALAGRRVGGMAPGALEGIVEGVAAEYAAATVHVDAPRGGFVADARELGLSVAKTATVRAVLATGRRGPLVERFTSWLTSFVRPRQAPVRLSVSPGHVYAVVSARDRARTPAVEPSLRTRPGGLAAVPGKPGRGIDPAEVVRELRAVEGGLPIDVRVGRGPVPPRFRLADASRVAAEAEALLAAPLPVTAGGVPARLSPDVMRTWARAVPTRDRLALEFDRAAIAQGLKEALASAGTPAVDARFVVEDTGIRLLPSSTGTGCCAPDAVEQVLRALRVRPSAPLVLPLARLDPALTTEQAAALGVKEQVSTFTTNYRAGEPRVRNIHRIADMVRGRVILPGTTFSVNQAVGRRTRAKGFVVAPVIENGFLKEDVGGGVSQFATTAFNAAFFAGLDFGEYQSHSLYISRYPYGREATLGFPHPDLQIRNRTPYGVVVWTTYTPTSITVSLYSTKHVDAQQTDQTRSARGPCTRVVTQRTRRYADGTTTVDTVAALYRPKEGVNCP